MMRVFISYSRKDGNDAAERLQHELEVRGFDVWRDVRDIDPAQDFTANIEQGIEGADWVAVCITPDTKRDNSFVRREIQYALLCKKPVIPLRFEKDIKPHISIINNEWVNFFDGWDAAFARLSAILGGMMNDFNIAVESNDPFREYVEQLYNRTVDYFKHAIIGGEPIELKSNPTPDAVDHSALSTPPHHINPLDQLFHAQLFEDAAPETETNPDGAITFTRFTDAFEYYDGRVLLLGEPGAGKTITLMAHTRNAAAARLDDPDAPLPLYHNIAFWDAEQQTPLVEWFTESYGDLLPWTALQREIGAGRVAFLLDGLDELGGERNIPHTKGRYDPRQRFMASLGALLPNRVLITCRVKDHAAIGQKIALNGAVTLRPLTDEQMRDYLRTMPDLWAALEMDEDLREVARTPLLLSLFVDGYKENAATAAQLRDLRTSPGELRDKIFETYVHKRYEREKRRVEQIGEALPFTLEEIYEVLGKAAVTEDRSSQVQIDQILHTNLTTRNVLLAEDFEYVELISPEQLNVFMELAMRLHLVGQRKETISGQSTYRFIHRLLRDYFAFSYAMQCLNGQDIGLHLVAIVALGVIGDQRAIEPLIASSRVNRDRGTWSLIVQALAQIGAPAVGPLVAALHDEDVEVCRRVANALGEIGDVRAVEPLIAALHDAAAGVRRAAVTALEQIGDVRAVEPLIVALHDEDYQVRFWVASALGEIGDVRAVEPLIAALHDEDDRVRRRAAAILEQIGILAVEPLIAALYDEDDWVRCRVASALGEIGDVRAVEPLIAALHDEDYQVRFWVASALGEIGDVRAVEPLIAALHDEDGAVSNRAAFALRKIGILAVEPLIAALHDEDAGVRRAVASALGEIGDIRAVEPLIVALHDEDGWVRRCAVAALGEIGDVRAVEPLIAALHDEDAGIRSDAATALEQIGIPAVEPLIAALHDEDDWVRRRTVSALRQIGDIRAVEPLIAALHDEDAGVRSVAAFALGEMGGERVVEQLIAALHDEDAGVCHRAATALEQIGTPEALAAATAVRKTRLRRRR